MQWLFLIGALAAAVAELHTGTFYLAGLAAAALISYGLGFWIGGTPLVVTFVALCAGTTLLVTLARQRRTRDHNLVDFDIGQSVLVRGAGQPGNRLTVDYRGAQWDAVMDDGSAPAPGDNVVIVRKTDKLLHLVSRS
jgi:membrane protein implicated in regulation of membrane protease activity